MRRFPLAQMAHSPCSQNQQWDTMRIQPPAHHHRNRHRMKTRMRWCMSRQGGEGVAVLSTAEHFEPILNRQILASKASTASTS